MIKSTLISTLMFVSSMVSAYSDLTSRASLDADSAVGALAAGFPATPKPSWTTGSLCTRNSPDFSEYRYPEQIEYCARNVSRETKRAIYERYGVPSGCRGEYTIDHFIPLSIGGTNHPNNLWPEHQSVKALRPNLETQLYRELAAGQITQQQAVARIRRAKLNPPVERLDIGSICH